MRVAFYKAHAGNGTILDTCISLGTLGRYSHVELVFPDGMSWSSSARDGGVRFKRIEYGGSEHWDMIDIGPLCLDIPAMRKEGRRLLGKGYDYLGVLPPPGIQTPGRLFCSEGCLKLMKVGGFRCGWPDSLVSPNRLGRIVRKALEGGVE